MQRGAVVVSLCCGPQPDRLDGHPIHPGPADTTTATGGGCVALVVFPLAVPSRLLQPSPHAMLTPDAPLPPCT